MNHLAEFIQRHPALIGIAVLLAIAALIIELRHRKSGGAAVGTNDAIRLMNAGALVIDVRTADQFAAGHIIDARHFAHTDIAAQADSLKKYRDKPVIVCCESGATSGTSARLLKAQGFTKVLNLRGGLQAWRQDNLPLVTGTAAGNGHQKKAIKAA